MFLHMLSCLIHHTLRTDIKSELLLSTSSSLNCPVSFPGFAFVLLTDDPVSMQEWAFKTNSTGYVPLRFKSSRVFFLIVTGTKFSRQRRRAPFSVILAFLPWYTTVSFPLVRKHSKLVPGCLCLECFPQPLAGVIVSEIFSRHSCLTLPLIHLLLNPVLLPSKLFLPSSPQLAWGATVNGRNNIWLRSIWLCGLCFICYVHLLPVLALFFLQVFYVLNKYTIGH